MPPPLPPDRGHLSTEQRHTGSVELDALTTSACVELMIDDHATITTSVRTAHADLSRFIDALVPRIRDSGRLIYIGTGTSGRLGVLDASECPPTFHSDPGQIIGLIAGGDAALRTSSEAKEDEPNGAAVEFERIDLNEHDTVLGITAGGTTPYVLGGIELAHARGAMTGLLTCAPREAPPGCDHLIVLATGPELLTGSTRLKAGSATKLALNIITTTLFVQLGKTLGNLMIDLRATNDKLTDRAIRILLELFPDLTRTSAHDLLGRANNQLKTAIVMQQRTVGLDKAERLIEEYRGRLRDVLARVNV